MSMNATFETWEELMQYLQDVDHPKCLMVNYLPNDDKYELWIGSQPYYSYEKLIDLEQKEKQWLYGKMNRISAIIEEARNESLKRY